MSPGVRHGIDRKIHKSVRGVKREGSEPVWGRGKVATPSGQVSRHGGGGHGDRGDKRGAAGSTGSRCALACWCTCFISQVCPVGPPRALPPGTCHLPTSLTPPLARPHSLSLHSLSLLASLSSLARALNPSPQSPSPSPLRSLTGLPYISSTSPACAQLDLLS
ncbi:hypothetical protein KC19_2G029000 [Ceratodon purpureus]|uniref:Uncharacterized protein n=1 Tax=Ceratodon purpureus TaxID=3225 RepID=A0A8T0ISB0_CERPU|nr:hypothetical protein KC19_2G029000 [Ceratodon purpureus]